MKISTTCKSLALVGAMLLTATAANAQTADQDTTIVVPETGYLAIKPSRNFTGPAGVIVCSCFGSNSSGLYFTKYNLNEVIVGSSTNSSSGLFIVAKPGTYTLTLTDAEVTGRINSTSVSWQSEPGQAYKKDRTLYKFVNTADQVGFLRDEKYAADNYQYCDMAEGENIYLPLAANNLTAIAKLMNTTAADLKFIPFAGPWKNVPSPKEAEENAAAAGVQTITPDTPAAPVYDLQGRRVQTPTPGIYIQQGRKMVVK